PPRVSRACTTPRAATTVCISGTVSRAIDGRKRGTHLWSRTCSTRANTGTSIDRFAAVPIGTSDIGYLAHPIVRRPRHSALWWACPTDHGPLSYPTPSPTHCRLLLGLGTTQMKADLATRVAGAGTVAQPSTYCRSRGNLCLVRSAGATSS